MRSSLKKLNLWLSAAIEAWAQGEADWLFENGYNELVYLHAHSMEITGGDFDAADDIICEYAKSRGVHPIKHRFRGTK